MHVQAEGKPSHRAQLMLVGARAKRVQPHWFWQSGPPWEGHQWRAPCLNLGAGQSQQRCLHLPICTFSSSNGIQVLSQVYSMHITVMY